MNCVPRITRIVEAANLKENIYEKVTIVRKERTDRNILLSFQDFHQLSKTELRNDEIISSLSKYILYLLTVNKQKERGMEQVKEVSGKNK